MANDNTARRQLYEVLNKEGRYNKSYEDFCTQFGNSGARAQLYNVLNKEGRYSKSADDFDKQFFGDMIDARNAQNLVTKPVVQQPVDTTPTAQASVQQAEQMNERDDAMAQGQVDWAEYQRKADRFNEIGKKWNDEATRINGDKENLAANREVLRNTFADRDEWVKLYDELYGDGGVSRYGLDNASESTAKLMSDLKKRKYLSRSPKEYEAMDVRSMDDYELESAYKQIAKEREKTASEAAAKTGVNPADKTKQMEERLRKAKVPEWMIGIDEFMLDIAKKVSPLVGMAYEYEHTVKDNVQSEWNEAYNKLGKEYVKRQRERGEEAVKARKAEREAIKSEEGSGRDLYTAAQFDRYTQEIYDAPDKWAQKEAGFWKSAGMALEGTGEGLAQIGNIPVAGSVIEWERYKHLGNVILKANDDMSNLTKSEKAMVEAYIANLKARDEVGSNLSHVYDVAYGGGESFAFMADMLIFDSVIKLGGKGAAKASMKIAERLAAMQAGKFGTKALKAIEKTAEVAAKGVGKGFGEYKAGNVVFEGAKGAKDLGYRAIGSAVQTAAMPRTWASLAEERAQIAYDQGREMTGVEILKNIWGSYKEVLTESAFNYANGKIVNGLWGGASKFMPRTAKWIEDKGKWTRFMSDKYRNFPEEMLEEYEGALLDIPVGIMTGDRQMVEEAENMFTAQGTADLIGGMAFQTLLMGGARTAATLHKGRQLKKSRELIESSLANAGVPSESAKGLIAYTEQAKNWDEFNDRARVLYAAMYESNVNSGMSEEEALKKANKDLQKYVNLYSEYNADLNIAGEQWAKMDDEEKARVREEYSAQLRKIRNAEYNSDKLDEIGKRYGIGDMRDLIERGQRGLLETADEVNAFTDVYESLIVGKVIDDAVAAEDAKIDGMTGRDGNVTRVTVDGREGTLVSEDGGTSIVRFENGDRQQVGSDRVRVVSSESADEIKARVAEETRKKIERENRFPVGSTMIMGDGKVGVIMSQDNNGVTVQRMEGKNPIVENPTWEELEGKDVVRISAGKKYGDLVVDSVGVNDNGERIVFIRDVNGEKEQSMTERDFIEMLDKSGVDLVGENYVPVEDEGGEAPGGAEGNGAEGVATPEGNGEEGGEKPGEKPGEEGDGGDTPPVGGIGGEEFDREAAKAELMELGKRFGVGIEFSDEKRVSNGRAVYGSFNVDKNSVTIYLNNIDNIGKAKAIVMHEVVGHYGMKQLFKGNERLFDAVMDNVYAGMSKTEIADRTKECEANKKWASMDDAGKRRLIAEEHLAKMAEEYLQREANGMLDDTFLKKVQNLFREVIAYFEALVGKGAMTESDMMNVVVASARNLEGGLRNENRLNENENENKNEDWKPVEAKFKVGDTVMYSNIMCKIGNVNNDGTYNLTGNVLEMNIVHNNVSEKDIREVGSDESRLFYKKQFADKFKKEKPTLDIANKIKAEFVKELDKLKSSIEGSEKVSAVDAENTMRIAGAIEACDEYIDNYKEKKPTKPAKPAKPAGNTAGTGAKPGGKRKIKAEDMKDIDIFNVKLDNASVSMDDVNAALEGFDEIFGEKLAVGDIAERELLAVGDAVELTKEQKKKLKDIGNTIAVFAIERGKIKFADFVETLTSIFEKKGMVENVRPYFGQFYMSAKMDPDLDEGIIAQMDSEEYVRGYFNKPAAPVEKPVILTEEEAMAKRMQEYIDEGCEFGYSKTIGKSGRLEYYATNIEKGYSAKLNKKEYDWAIAHGAKKQSEQHTKDLNDESDYGRLLEWFTSQYPHRELADVYAAWRDKELVLDIDREIFDKLKRLVELSNDKRKRIDRIANYNGVEKEKPVTLIEQIDNALENNGGNVLPGGENGVTLQGDNNNETNNGNGNEEQVRNGSTEEGGEGHGGEQDTQMGGSTGEEDVKPDGRRMGGRNTGNTMPVGNGSSGVSRVSESAENVIEKKNQRNHHTESGKDYAPKSVSSRIDANIAAIELLNELEANGQIANKKQKDILLKYSGWGGLGKAFNDWQTQNRLREILGDNGYKDAFESRFSAFYTPANIIGTMWNIVKALGFKGGNILEGSAGIGNILGLMPKEISDNSDITAVEIDKTTGGILRQLYPDARVHIQGFEKTKIRNGSIDLAITNVPFITDWKVNDESGDHDLSKMFGDIHDFCIAKNIRKLKEGGLGVFITSSGTLDNSNKLRKWIVNEGNTDVIGAFRLNNETFEGANVTSDIIVVRKRIGEKKSNNSIDVLNTSTIRVVPITTQEKGYPYREDTKEYPLSYNQYFVENPDKMGGEAFFGYEKGDTYRPTSRNVYPAKGIDQNKRLAEWEESFSNMKSEDKIISTSEETIKEYRELGDNVKEGGLFVNKDGNVCIARYGVEIPLDKQKVKIKGHTKAEALNSYLAIKDAASELLRYEEENESDEGLQPLLNKLNKAYDDFVKVYGHFHGRNISMSMFKKDVDFAEVQALETYKQEPTISGEKIETFGKSDIFKKRVLSNKKEPKPKNIRDAAIASVYENGGVNLEYIANKLNITQEEAKKQLIEGKYAYEDPMTGGMEIAFKYLSGNVREKLRQAEENNDNGRFNANIEALNKVVPMTIPIHQIHFTFGSSWIEPKQYEDYIYDVTGIRVQLINNGGRWSMRVPGGDNNQNNYAIRTVEKNIASGVRSRISGKIILGTMIMESALNFRTIVVDYDGGDGKKIVDKEATSVCMDKIDTYKDQFNDWFRTKLQNDEKLAKRMEDAYNDKFNSYAPVAIGDEYIPEYFDGADHKYKMRPHQARAIIKGTMQPLMLAHEVGTGKTFTLISIAMEMRRLGTAKKPMIVVQNSTVSQFAASAKALYPHAKILVPNEKDAGESGRKDFYAKIRYNDWDMIIIPQSVLSTIPDSEERKKAFVQEKIDEQMMVLSKAKESNDRSSINKAEKELKDLKDELNAVDGIESKKKGKDKSDKNAAKAANNAKVRAEEQLIRKVDDVSNFDQMGVDAILIDEAHGYKRFRYASGIGREVKGITKDGSEKSVSTYLKVKSVLEKNNGRNVIFATGTPISNTAAEVWVFMKYLMSPAEMKKYDIYYFDDFVRNFGNITTMMAHTTTGAFKEEKRFAGYINLPELVRLWNTVADTVLTKEAGEVLESVPQMLTDKAIDIRLEQTKEFRSVMKQIIKRIEEYEKMSGKEKKENSHIPLVCYNLAQQAAIDVRLVANTDADPYNSKTNEAVRQTLKALDESKEYNGTVVIFSDRYRNKQTGFNLYEDIKEKLIAGGIPKEQIVIINDIPKNKHADIFDDFNAGRIRVLLGGTEKLGVGVNIQERLYTAIHLDAPNRPMDYTQRNGRILRQGNIHKALGIPVKVLRIGVNGSLDVTAYQRLKTKGAIADSMMKGKELLKNPSEMRVIEEEGDEFGNMTAQLSGSEYAMLLNQAERDLRKYEAREKMWEQDQIYVVQAQRFNEKWIAELKNKDIPYYESVLETINKAYDDKGKIIIEYKGKKYEHTYEMTDVFKEINKQVTALMEEVRKKGAEENYDVEKNLTTEIKFGKLTFIFDTLLKYDSWRKEVNRTCYYSCHEIMDKSLPATQGYVKNGVDDILHDILSGEDTRRKINNANAQIEKLQSDNELLKSREGKPFEDAAKLKETKAKIVEYTDKMKVELQENKNKYAELDKDIEEIELSSNSDETEDDMDDNNDEEEDSERLAVSSELDERYPNWNDTQTTSKGGHSTQITGTTRTYQKIGQWLIDNGYENANILDASSGKGLGTVAMREMGLNVDDVEPYAPNDRELPTYSSYDDIDKEYDVIISNAVLNVIPDDWRRDVLKNMAEHLSDNGIMIVNTRGLSEAKNVKNKVEIDDASEILISNGKGGYRSYQKFFTHETLANFIKETLGDGYTIERATEKNSGIANEQAVVVRKGAGVSDIPTIAESKNETMRAIAEALGSEGNEVDAADEERLAVSDDMIEVAQREIEWVRMGMPEYDGSKSLVEYFSEYAKWRDEKKNGERVSAEARAEYERMFDAEFPMLPKYESGMSVSEYINAFDAFRQMYDACRVVADFNKAQREGIRAWQRVERVMWERNNMLEKWQSDIAKALGWKEMKSEYDVLSALNHVSSIVNARVREYEGKERAALIDAVAEISDQAVEEMGKAQRQHTQGSTFRRKIRRPSKIALRGVDGKMWEPQWRWQNVDDTDTDEGDKRNGQLLNTVEIIELYLMAKDAIEAEQLGLPDRGMEGFSTQIDDGGKNDVFDMFTIVEEFENNIGEEKCQALQKAVRDATSFAMRELLRGGMISQEQYNETMMYDEKAKEFKRKHYVPQRGWAFESYLDDTVFSDAMKHAEGRTTLATNPLAYIDIIAKTSINTAEKNIAKQSLYRLTHDQKAAGELTGAFSATKVYTYTYYNTATGEEETKETITPMSEEAIEENRAIYQEHIAPLVLRKAQLSSQYKRILKKYGECEMLEEVADELKAVEEEIEEKMIETGYVESLRKVRKGNDMKYDPDRKRIVRVKVDGETYDISLSSRDAARNINGYYTNEKTEKFIKGFRTFATRNLAGVSLEGVTRFFSALKTQFSPVFAIANLSRDVKFAFTMNMLEHNPAFATKAVKNSFGSIGVIASYLKGTLDEYEDKELRDLFKEFVDNGAITGYSFATEMPELKETLDKALKEAKRKMAKDKAKSDYESADINLIQYVCEEIKNSTFKGAAKAVGKKCELISQLSELMTRFGQYRTVREEQMAKGEKDILAAINEAKEITTNFNRAGEISAILGPFYYFTNATLQGGYREIRAGMKHPWKVTAACSAWVVFGALMAALQPDDPDDERFIPDYVWETYIPIPGTRVRIPAPHFFRNFFYLGANLTFAYKNKKTWGEAMLDGWTNIIEDNLPTPMKVLSYIDLNNAAKSREDKWYQFDINIDLKMMARDKMPSLVQPYFDIKTNRTFTGASIYKEPFSDKMLYNPTQMYYSSTNQYLIDVCNWIQRMTGGTNEAKDNRGIAINPAKIQYAIEQYGSGAPAEFIKLLSNGASVINAAISADAEKLPTLDKTFLIGRFYQPYAKDRMENAYYWNLKEICDNYASFVSGQNNAGNEEEYSKWVDSAHNEVYEESLEILNEVSDKMKYDEPLTNEEIEKLMEMGRKWNRVSSGMSVEE